jgi:drug/metabolite transporter (DMT)-like permease
MIWASVFMIVAIILTGVAQVFLKIGSKNSGKNKSVLGPYLNVSTISGYVLFLISTIFLAYSLKEIPLKEYAAMSALNFFIVLVLSWILLHEKITWLRVAAIFVIISGIVIFNM